MYVGMAMFLAQTTAQEMFGRIGITTLSFATVIAERKGTDMPDNFADTGVDQAWSSPSCIKVSSYEWKK
jgi:hypothetical protein